MWVFFLSEFVSNEIRRDLVKVVRIRGMYITKLESLCRTVESFY